MNGACVVDRTPLMTSSYVEEHVPWYPRVASVEYCMVMYVKKFLGMQYLTVKLVVVMWTSVWSFTCSVLYRIYCNKPILVVIWRFSYSFLLSVWYILLKKRCGSTARKNLTIGTHLKTGPQKTLENKNEMDRKRPCLENKKAKLLGQAHVAREN